MNNNKEDDPRIPGHARNTLRVRQKSNTELKSMLKKKISKIAKCSSSLAYGVYQKLKDTIQKPKQKDKKFRELTSSKEDFPDKDFFLDEPLLEPLKRKDMTYISRYSIHKYFQNKEFEIFKNVSIDGQVLRDRRCSYVIDTLNTLSTQPGLLMRLFEDLEVNEKGVYQIWLNINGAWEQVLIDDSVPVFGNSAGKAQFLHLSPNINPENNEIWMILLFKALAKVYGGYQNLYLGNQNYLLKDLTGAPVTVDNIVYIHEKQKLTEREFQHMDNLWKDMTKALKKGYPAAVSPRPPTEHEIARNQFLNVQSKKFYLDNGIYFGHSYAVVTAKEVKNQAGEMVKLVKLRNPWINEKWTGEWSNNSEEWNDELREVLNYPKLEKEGNEFWMPLRNLMHYFEDFIVCKAKPDSVYSNCQISYPDKNFLRAVVRLSVKEKGKYCISIDQKDPTFLGSRETKNLPVKLSLCKLENDQFKLLSYTSSNSLRNTFIRKLIDKGEYFLLVEQNSLGLDREKLTQENEDLWREVNVTTYGPKSCGIKVVECEEIHIIHDFLLYESWKSYAEERIGRRVSSFNLTFDDGNQGSLSIYMLNVPNTVVYVFKNDNDYGVDINTEMIGIENLEVVGPEGKVGFNQHFKIDSGQRDIFILRQTEKILKTSENNKQKFQVKSIVGARYFGNKAKSNNQCKVYDFMYYDVPYCVNCNIEKFPELKMFQLFDEKGKTIDLCYEDMEIRVKKKSIVQAPRANSKAMIKDISKSQDKGKSLEAKPPKPKKKKKKIKEKVDKKSEKKKIKEEKVDKESEKKKSFIKEEIFKEELKEIRKLDEPEKIEKLDSKMVSEMMIERSQNQIQDDDKVQKKKEMKKKPRRSSDLFKIKRDDMKKSKKMEEENKQKSKGKKNIDLAKFLGMNKEEILTQNNEEVLHLLNYTGIDAFCSIYKANQAYLDRLYLKLESGSNKNEKTPKPKNIDESDYNLVSTVNYTLKNNSGGLNFDSYSREKYRQKNENEGELNKSKNPPVFFYTESFRENRKSLKKGKSKNIRSLKNPKKEVKKKLFHDEKKQDNSTDDVFKGPTKNFMNAFSKTRNIFKNKNPGKKLNRNSYQAKLGKIEIQEQKLKESLVKSHLSRANQDEVQATPPIQKKKARKSAYGLKRNSPRAYSNNILSKLRKDYIPAKNTPMKPAYDNPKKNQLNKPNRSVSPIFMQKKKISDLNFFGSPQEKKNEIQGLRSNVISSNRKNNFFSGREENGNSSTSVIQRRTNHERGQSNVSKSRKYNRYSLDRMTNLTQNYISSKAKKSYGDMSISSRKRQSLNPAESSPPYKLLRTNKLNISKESSSLLSTVTKRPRITKFQEIQKKFLTKVANEVMCNSTNFSRSNGKIMNNWNFEGRIERGVYLKKESILDSEIQDIDNGGAIVDLKLVQPSVNSSSRNIGIFNDKMYFSTQENLFDSHRKMKNQNFGALNLGISNKDHSSIDRLHLNRDSNRRKNTNEKIVQSKVFSFREKNQNFENHYNSVSRNHSRDIAAKKSIPVLQLRRLTKDRRNSAARSNELNIPYEGSAMGSCCSKENASSVFMQRPREYRSTFERKNPEIQKSYERVQRQNRNYLIQSGVSKPLSLVNRQRNFGTGDSLGVSRVKNSQVIDDVNFDLGKNFGNFSVCREVKQAPLKVKDNNVMSVLQRPFGRRKSRTKRTQNSISKRSFDSVQGSRENVMVGVQNFMDKNNRNFNSNLPKSRRKKEDSLLSQGFKPENRRNLGGLKFYQPERNVNGRGVLSRNRRSYNF